MTSFVAVRPMSSSWACTRPAASSASARRQPSPRQPASTSAFMAFSRRASPPAATNQVAATINNMDDGNQIMWQLLEEDIVTRPNLVPKDGALARI